MNWNKARRAVAIVLALVGAPPALARAEDSNRNEVRSNLGKGGWSIIWGKNFTEGDWALGSAAIAESVATENPGPFLKWFEETLQENFNKILANAPGVAERDLKRWVAQSLREKKIVVYRNLRIEAGFATYNRWQRVVYDEPATRTKTVKIGPLKTDVPEVYMHRVEKQIPLPNWHQFYLRYQLVGQQSQPATGGGPGPRPPTGGGPAPALDHYRIKLSNQTNKPLFVYVHFQALSGKWETRSYPLGPGNVHEINARTRNRIVYFRAEGQNYLADGGPQGTVTSDGRKYSRTEMTPKIGTWAHVFK